MRIKNVCKGRDAAHDDSVGEESVANRRDYVVDVVFGRGGVAECEEARERKDCGRDDEENAELGLIDGVVAAGHDEGEFIGDEGSRKEGEESTEEGSGVHVAELGGSEICRRAGEELCEDKGHSDTL